MPNIQVQLRRGTEAENDAFTGSAGEVVVNTSNNTLRVHDGSTAGGHEVLKGDNSFLIVDSTGVTINDSNLDADFVVKASGLGTLINADAGNYQVDLAPTAAANSLAVYNPSGSPTAIEGGQIYLNKSTQSSGSFSEADSFSLDAYKDAANSYQHGSNAQLMRIIQTSGAATTSFAENGDISFSGDLFPVLNGAYDLGTSALKWRDVYSTTGAFNGSDANLKQDIEELSEAEKRVAVAAKGLLKKYRLKQAVKEKGENARYHFGIVAQELQAAFQAEGLDPMKYGIIAVNTWYEKTEGDKKYISKKQEEGYQQVTEMSVRYSELLAFIIAAL
jgi:hypothetical protein